MTEVFDSAVRDLLHALGKDSADAKLAAEIQALLAIHDTAVLHNDTAKPRMENMALAAVYISCNYVQFPSRITLADMSKAAATTPAWQSEPAPGKKGMNKIVKNFTHRICPIEHEPEALERGGESAVACTRCHLIIRLGLDPRSDAKAFSQSTEDDAGLPPKAVKSMIQDDPAIRVDLDVEEPVEESVSDKSQSTPVIKESKPPARKGKKQKLAESGVSPVDLGPADPAIVAKVAGTAKPLQASEGGEGVESGEGAGQAKVNENVETAEDANPVEAGMASGQAEAGATPLASIAGTVRVKWVASVRTAMEKLVVDLPVLEPAVPGAMMLVERGGIDSYICTEQVNGAIARKVARMALLHEGKMQKLPVTTKTLNVTTRDYVDFLKNASAAKVEAPAAIDEAAIADRAVDLISSYAGKPVSPEIRERVTRFHAAARRKLMGFTPTTAAALIAYIDISRGGGEVNMSMIANHVGTKPASLFNAIVRFLGKIGRPGDPDTPLLDRVRAAFPPRGTP